MAPTKTDQLEPARVYMPEKLKAKVETRAARMRRSFSAQMCEYAERGLAEDDKAAS